MTLSLALFLTIFLGLVEPEEPLSPSFRSSIDQQFDVLSWQLDAKIESESHNGDYDTVISKQENSQREGDQMEEEEKEEPRVFNYQKGPWMPMEIAKFHEFIALEGDVSFKKGLHYTESSTVDTKVKKQRRRRNFFQEMSEFIGTRDRHQCRSRDQKYWKDRLNKPKIVHKSLRQMVREAAEKKEALYIALQLCARRIRQMNW